MSSENKNTPNSDPNGENESSENEALKDIILASAGQNTSSTESSPEKTETSDKNVEDPEKTLEIANADQITKDDNVEIANIETASGEENLPQEEVQEENAPLSSNALTTKETDNSTLKNSAEMETLPEAIGISVKSKGTTTDFTTINWEDEDQSQITATLINSQIFSDTTSDSGPKEIKTLPSLVNPGHPVIIDVITAEAQSITIDVMDRIVPMYGIGAAVPTDANPRAFGWGVGTEGKGWDYFIENHAQKMVDSGAKRLEIHNPFGQIQYVRNEAGEWVKEPGEWAMQFTQYQDAAEQVPVATETFVPAWSTFIAENPDLDVIAYIGAPGTDADVGNYLGIQHLVGQTINGVKVRPDDLNIAEDPAKAETIWGDLIWPNILPLLEAGIRSIGLDASPQSVENSITYLLAQKLMFPETRDPATDQDLIDILGDESVTVFVEARQHADQPHWFKFPLMILEEFYHRSDPEKFADSQYGARNSQIEGEIMRIIRYETEDFEQLARVLADGDSATIYPPEVYAANRNLPNTNILEEILESIDLPAALPTHIKLSGQGPEGATLRYVIVDGPQNGTLVPNPDNANIFTYTAHEFYYGADSFSYYVTDGTSISKTVTVSLDVATIPGVNDFEDFNSGQIFDTIPDDEDNDLLGTDDDDTINGLGGADKLLGGLGNDTLNGGDGNDKLLGHRGDDELTGGAGNDYLKGGTGNDKLFGGEGKDILLGSEGNDEIHGGADNDKIYDRHGDNKIWGDEGKDIIETGKGNDEIRGGSGNDTIKSGAGNDKVYGEEGNDKLYLDRGTNEITGGAGADTFVGKFLWTDAADKIMDFNIEEGDLLDLTNVIKNFNPETDDITDHLRITEKGSTIHIEYKRGVHGFFPIADIENGADVKFRVKTSSGGTQEFTINSTAITIQGTSNDDTLLGGDSDDEIFGGNGDDNIDGRGGSDNMTGGAGADIFHLLNFNGDAIDVIKDYSILENDMVDFGDTFSWHDPANGDITNFIRMGEDGDKKYIEIKEDLNSAFKKVVEVYGTSKILARYDDDEGNQNTIELNLNKTIEGSQNDDVLNGGSGADDLYGHDGDDVLNGGSGANTLTGGAGKDVFQFSNVILGETDTVTDFNLSEGDVLDVSAVLESYDPVNDAISDFVRLTKENDDLRLEIRSDGISGEFTIAAEIVDGASIITDAISSEQELQALLNSGSMIA